MKVFILFLFFTCFASTKAEVRDNSSKYKLVWSDEFNYKGKPDSKKWRFEYGFVRNQESQFYTDRKKNARVKNGNLIIESRKEKFRNKLFISKEDKSWRFNRKYAKYTSASLTTKALAEWKYGKIEVRAKLPKGIGSWSAFWLLGENKKGYAEIDIMENVGFSSNFIHGTIHAKPFKEQKIIEKSGRIEIDKPYNEFHVYSVEWTEKKIAFMLDGKVYYQINKDKKTSKYWTFDQNFHLKINNAIGGKWGGQRGIDDKSFPQKLYVDYVRVFQLDC